MKAYDSFKMMISEQIVLKIFTENDIDVESNLLSPMGKDIYDAIKEAKEDNKDASIITNVLTSSACYDVEMLEDIYSIEYDKTDIMKYIVDFKKKVILNRALAEFQSNVDSNTTDSEKLNELNITLENAINNLKNFDEKDYYTFSDLIENHINVIQRRKEGIKNEIGEYTLDNLFPKLEAGLISIVGYSGSTKSTLISHIALQRIKLRLPTTMFNTELSKDALVDGMCSELLRIAYNDVCGINNSDEHIDFSSLVEELKNILTTSSKFTKYALWSRATASVKDVILFNKEMRRVWNVPKNVPIVCLVDLASMLKEFNNVNTNKASAYEDAVNELNLHCLDENIIMIATFQLKRDDYKGQIKKLEDLDKYEPSLNMIKNAGAIEERSRVVLGIFNRKHVLKKSPHDEILEDICCPAIELKCLKNSFGPVGNKCKFMFNSDYKCYDTWTQEDEDLWASIEKEHKDEQLEEEANGQSYQDSEGNWHLGTEEFGDVTSSYCH